jgi:hypothetical protein
VSGPSIRHHGSGGYAGEIDSAGFSIHTRPPGGFAWARVYRDGLRRFAIEELVVRVEVVNHLVRTGPSTGKGHREPGALRDVTRLRVEYQDFDLSVYRAQTADEGVASIQLGQVHLELVALNSKNGPFHPCSHLDWIGRAQPPPAAE